MNNSSDGFNNPFQINQNDNFSPSSRRGKRGKQSSKQSLWWIPVTTVLGFFAVIVIAFFSLIAFFTYSVEKFGSAFEHKPVYVAQNSVLKLNFSDLSEVSNTENPFTLFSSKAPKPTFYQVIEGIKEAANDDRIAGIYYEEASSLSGAMAKELQNALMDFKKSGKFIYSYLETADKRGYYTALASDSIFVPDVGLYDWTGFGISVIFPKGLYDKIGLEFTVSQYGDFKTAGEQYNSKRFSDSAKLAYRPLIAQRENEFIATVAERRGLTKEKVVEYLSKGIIDSDEMLKLKLADAKASKQEVMEFLVARSKNNSQNNSEDSENNLEDSEEKITKSQFGFSFNYEKKCNAIFASSSCDCSGSGCGASSFDNLLKISDYVASIKNRKNTNRKDDAIAIICGEGAIVSTRISSPFMQQETAIVSSDFVKLIRRAKNDDNVKGIIIRINSPGGSVIASEEIYQAILDAKKVKPVYASMSDIAASGGYYIAMACDTIIAHPYTVTGSIGVVSAFPNFSKLLNKLNMTVDTISNGVGNSFFLDPSLPRNRENEIKFDKMSLAIYNRFVSKAAQSRKMSVEQMGTVAKGRIWIGEDAYQRGLVDTLGDFQTAIALMKTRIGKSENETVNLKFLPDETDRMQALLRLFEDMSLSAIIDAITGRMSSNSKQDFANSLMLSQEIQKQISYLQTLAIISEKEKVLMALPNLVEVR